MPDKSEHSASQRISAEGIATMIREHIHRRRHDRSSNALQSRVHSSFTVDVRAFIAQAEFNSDAGECVTPMEQFTGITRKLALFIGKFVVYLVSFITDKQRKCNRGIILALRSIADGMDGLNKESASTAQEMKMLRKEIEQLKENLAFMSKAAVEESNATAIKLHGIHGAVLEQERRLTLFFEKGCKNLPVGK
jgi:hypothetical protein